MEIAARCKDILWRHYGSTVRGDPTAGSDIDLLVLLASPVNYLDELWNIIKLLYRVQLDSARLISTIPAAADDFEQGAIHLYRNARREGVAL
jgi:predicted nucleotidyltransferase